MRIDSTNSKLGSAYGAQTVRKVQSQPAQPAETTSNAVTDKVKLSPVSYSISKAIQLQEKMDLPDVNQVSKGRDAIQNWSGIGNDDMRKIVSGLLSEA